MNKDSWFPFLRIFRLAPLLFRYVISEIWAACLVALTSRLILSRVNMVTSLTNVQWKNDRLSVNLYKQFDDIKYEPLRM